MVASLRQFLTVLIVLLQFAAPLVHAHVGHDGGKSGLHLQAFETLKYSGDTAALVSSDQQIGRLTAIVEVGSAIKVSQSDEDFSPVFFLLGDTPIIPLYRAVGRINFSPHALPLVSRLFSSSNSPRAPPV